MNNVFAMMRRAFDAGGLTSLRGTPNLRKRTRLTIAQVNAGATLIPAPGPGYRLNFVDAKVTAIGGAAAATTTVDIKGTRGGSAVKLVAIAVAALTQSAVNRAGATNNTVLADGASFTEDLDANTAITAGVTGAAVTTATHIDFDIVYTVTTV